MELHLGEGDKLLKSFWISIKVQTNEGAIVGIIQATLSGRGSGWGLLQSLKQHLNEILNYIYTTFSHLGSVTQKPWVSIYLDCPKIYTKTYKFVALKQYSALFDLELKGTDGTKN